MFLQTQTIVNIWFCLTFIPHLLLYVVFIFSIPYSQVLHPEQRDGLAQRVTLMAMLTNRHAVFLAVNHTLALAQISSVMEMAQCLSGDSKWPEGKPRGFLQ